MEKSQPQAAMPFISMVVIRIQLLGTLLAYQQIIGEKRFIYAMVMIIQYLGILGIFQDLMVFIYKSKVEILTVIKSKE